MVLESLRNRDLSVKRMTPEIHQAAPPVPIPSQEEMEGFVKNLRSGIRWHRGDRQRIGTDLAILAFNQYDPIGLKRAKIKDTRFHDALVSTELNSVDLPMHLTGGIALKYFYPDRFATEFKPQTDEFFAEFYTKKYARRRGKDNDNEVDAHLFLGTKLLYPDRKHWSVIADLEGCLGDVVQKKKWESAAKIAAVVRLDRGTPFQRSETVFDREFQDGVKQALDEATDPQARAEMYYALSIIYADEAKITEDGRVEFTPPSPNLKQQAVVQPVERSF